MIVLAATVVHSDAAVSGTIVTALESTSCESAFRSELASGSTSDKSISEMLEDERGAFLGTFGSEPAIRGYFCRNGFVTSQSFIMTYANERLALAAYRRVLLRLQEQFGKPCKPLDTFPSTQIRTIRMEMPALIDELKYTREWKHTEGTLTRLTIHYLSGEREWRVNVVTDGTEGLCRV
jgi:hypothetical protein